WAAPHPAAASARATVTRGGVATCARSTAVGARARRPHRGAAGTPGPRDVRCNDAVVDGQRADRGDATAVPTGAAVAGRPVAPGARPGHGRAVAAVARPVVRHGRASQGQRPTVEDASA